MPAPAPVEAACRRVSQWLAAAFQCLAVPSGDGARRGRALGSPTVRHPKRLCNRHVCQKMEGTPGVARANPEIAAAEPPRGSFPNLYLCLACLALFSFSYPRGLPCRKLRPMANTYDFVSFQKSPIGRRPLRPPSIGQSARPRVGNETRFRICSLPAI